MRKRIIAAVLMATLACIAMIGCGAKKPAEPLDLTGNWEEKDTSDGYQAGYIKDDEIYLFWVSDGGDTKMLYWAGTYVAPTDDAVPYTWEVVTRTNAVKSPTNSPETTKLVYTVKEVAQMLAISQRAAYNLCNSTTEFRVLRAGGSIRIPKDSFDAWLYRAA